MVPGRIGNILLCALNLYISLCTHLSPCTTVHKAYVALHLIISLCIYVSSLAVNLWSGESRAVHLYIPEPRFIAWHVLKILCFWNKLNERVSYLLVIFHIISPKIHVLSSPHCAGLGFCTYWVLWFQIDLGILKHWADKISTEIRDVGALIVWGKTH